jgi:hypothetical protein
MQRLPGTKKKKVVPAKAFGSSANPKTLEEMGIYVSDEEKAVIEAEAEVLKVQKEWKSKLESAMTGADGKLKINPDYYTSAVIQGGDDVLVPVIDPGAIPVENIPPDMAFLPADTPPKKLKGYILDPTNLKLMDPNTGAYVEDQLDQEALAILKGNKPPKSEGYELGQYPGPPVIDAQKLKELAGDPFGPIPNVSLSIEMGKAPDGSPCFVKKTVIETPKGKKVYTLPIMQKGKKVTQLPFAV